MSMRCYANTGIGTLMTTSLFPTLLHQDPRYFQLGSGGVWHRTVYSLSRIFVTRADNGDIQFNSSEIAGNAVTAGISNPYHSQSQRTLSTLSVWGTDVMLNAVCNMAKEFWPDLSSQAAEVEICLTMAASTAYRVATADLIRESRLIGS